MTGYRCEGEKWVLLALPHGQENVAHATEGIGGLAANSTILFGFDRQGGQAGSLSAIWFAMGSFTCGYCY